MGRALVVGSLIGVSLVSIGAAAFGSSPSPRQAVESALAEIVAVLTPASSDGPRPPQTATERRTRIREIVGSVVDFEEMSRRALGSHWAGRSPAERADFVDLFTRLLVQSYFGKIEMLTGQRMSFVSETAAGGEAVVRWKVGPHVTDLGAEYAGRRVEDTEVEYRLHLRDGRWRIFDLGVDGLGLIEMYRGQFNRVIQTQSYEALIARLRQKVDQSAVGLPRS